MKYINAIINCTKHIDEIKIHLYNSESDFHTIKEDNEISFIGMLSDHINFIIDEIEKYLISKRNTINCSLKAVIDSLEKIRTDYHRAEWVKFNKKMLKEIKYNNFSVTKNYIIYKEKIPLEHIQYQNKLYKVPDDIVIKQKLYITRVRMLIYKTLCTSIVCTGSHPNLDPVSKQFCLDPVIAELDLNYRNLMMVIGCMKIANLDKCYQFTKYHNIFNQLIKGEIDEK